jgi:prepilin-type N-terminal cleavage/methylation domain-containing protein
VSGTCITTTTDEGRPDMDRRPASAPHEGDRESGFSLVEVLVAMVLLSVIALAFLPLIARAMQTAATGSQLATATRLVSEQMELVRVAPVTTCPASGPEPLGSSLGDLVAGPHGVQFQTWTKYVGSCTVPGSVRYVVSVTVAGKPADVVASASTLVYVGAP